MLPVDLTPLESHLRAAVTDINKGHVHRSLRSHRTGVPFQEPIGKGHSGSFVNDLMKESRGSKQHVRSAGSIGANRFQPREKRHDRKILKVASDFIL